MRRMSSGGSLWRGEKEKLSAKGLVSRGRCCLSTRLSNLNKNRITSINISLYQIDLERRQNCFVNGG
jgi:hypothetical protein